MGGKFSDTLGRHSFPASHALALTELVQRWRVTPIALLEPLGLREEDLLAPDARVTVEDFVALVERARALTGEPGLGYYLGVQMRVSAHGYLGFAAMTSATLREAIELAARFAPTRSTAMALRVQESERTAAVVLEERADFGSARDVLVSALMVGLWKIGNALTERTLEGTADFAYAEPEYFTRFAHLAPRVRFGQPANRLVFDRALLDTPIPMADPAAQRLAREQCERELAALGGGGGLVERVRAMIAAATPASDDEARALGTLEGVARALHVSPRTLKRRLAAEGAAYSAILAQVQRDAALLLLRDPERSVEQVAESLGYSDVANFTRAFRRWTGVTPGAYRRSGR